MRRLGSYGVAWLERCVLKTRRACACCRKGTPSSRHSRGGSRTGTEEACRRGVRRLVPATSGTRRSRMRPMRRPCISTAATTIARFTTRRPRTPCGRWGRELNRLGARSIHEWGVELIGGDHARRHTGDHCSQRVRAGGPRRHPRGARGVEPRLRPRRRQVGRGRPTYSFVTTAQVSRPYAPTGMRLSAPRRRRNAATCLALEHGGAGRTSSGTASAFGSSS
jgi:hypothetical protein